MQSYGAPPAGPPGGYGAAPAGGGTPSALKVQGRAGRHWQINGDYEPLGQMHNDRPVWVSRAVQPMYIFHTGKTRWVISKRMDDGSKCYGFKQDTGNTPDPATCKGPWVCCDEHGEWAADANVSCVTAVAANDMFSKLRLTLDGELQKLGINDNTSLKTLWKRLDYNGNNIVSLAEIDKLVVEKTDGGSWPAWLNNKPALMRAYKKTLAQSDKGGQDGWIRKGDFHALMLNIFWFNRLYQIFDNMDGDDRRMDVNEFVRGMVQLGLNMSPQDANAEFGKIDSNHGGQVLFVEFCAYVRKRVNPDANPNFDADIVSGEKCGQVVRKGHGHKATHTHYVSKKCLRDFDAAEGKIKALMQDRQQLKDLWSHMDFNGNGIISLAEIDKCVVEKFPLLNHKPALMRAYKATINASDSNGDDWVQRKEFKRLLGNLFYFNKAYWIFENQDGDKDRRMDFPEFKNCLTLVAGSAGMKDAEMKADFDKVDRNGGGIILFDEFCRYFTQKACPQCLQDLVD